MVQLAHRYVLGFAAAGLGALLAVGPAGSALAKVFDPKVYMLKNGLQVIVVENHLSPVVTQMVWYCTGSADEDPGKSGIAHFLEHLMFKGTASVGAGDFSKTIGRNGGTDNAFTNFDYTAYFQTIKADRLELVMKLESDRMQNLKLTDDQVLPERDVIVEERRQRIDNSPSSRMDEALRYTFFVNSPYGRDVIGWQPEMMALSTADANAWHDKWYTPSNAILIVVGDVKPDEVKALADKYYGPIAARPVPERKRTQLVAMPGTEKRITLRDPDIHQPSLTRFYAAPNYSAKTKKQALALEVFDEIFGGGQTSRLYQALVVKAKVASSAGAGYDDTALDPSYFGIFASPAPGKDIAEVEKAIDEEVQKILKSGVTDAEVADAKTRLEDAALSARDSLMGPAMSLGQSLTTGQTVEDVENWPANISAVTTADVTAAAQAMFKNASATGWLLPMQGTKAPLDAAEAANTTPSAGPVQ